MKKYSYVPGFLLLVAAFIHYMYSGGWTNTDLALCVGGGAIFLLSIGLNWNDIVEWFKDPRGIFALNTGISFVVLTAILVLINFLAFAHPKSIDMTQSGRNTLSQGTRDFLGKLNRDVGIRQFGRAHNAQIDQLLASFAEANNHVRLEFVDVDRNLREARAYGITKPNGTIIVSVGEKATKDKASTVRFRKIEDVNEPTLVSAMLQVLNNKMPVLCFVGGHGEHGLNDKGPGGAANIAALLQISNFAVGTVAPLEEDIPADCSAVVLAGPHQDLQPVELQRLDAYVRAGGHLAVLLDPPAPASVVSWLRPWGFKVDEGVVLDSSGASQQVGAPPDSLVVTGYGSHPITSGFEVATLFGRACPIEVGQSINGGEPQMVAQSGPRSFLRRDTADVVNVEFDKTRDSRGPFSIAVASSAGVPASVSRDARRSEEKRLVVFGDSDFMSNANLLLWGNRDLFLHTVSWLVGEQDLTIVNVAERENRRVAMTQTMKATMFIVNILVLPLIPLVAGIIVLVRSKR